MSERASRLPAWKLLGVSFAVTLGVWLFFSWPLPRYLADGIPAAAHREAADVRNLIPGDHLQFMYYCWLAGDMVSGRTPLFYNLYEFNTGNDRERFEPYAYYLPFSLIHAFGERLGGPAFGWNLAGFISIWLTYLLTWLLARRWTRNELIAAVAALLGIILPFRWINLFGGSPAGFAMAWIPAILLGVDMAVSEDRIGGGILAGTSLLLASWGDSHVFFFGTLAVPVWGIIAFTVRSSFQWRGVAGYRSLALALLPIAFFAVAALMVPLMMKGLFRAVTGLAPVAHAIGPRTLREVMLYSPDWRGFLGLSNLGAAAQIYVGYGIVLFILAGCLVAGWSLLSQGRRAAAGEDDRARRAALAFALVILAMLAIMILATGPRGPGDGFFFKLGRRFIPPYALIRQPAKIFCLMPSFLAVAAALALGALVRVRFRAATLRAWSILLPVAFAAFILRDYARQCHPTISLLEKEQGAYAAVAADTAVPRALVLPLWPGDSHYASVYQYFASMNRVRMVNGYNPFIRQGYFENVFCRFESVNQGGLSEEQLAGLLRMNVRYIILHENLFPEKVSPFPVASTLRQLLGNPRLELLRQAGSVWAFKIAEKPRKQTPPSPDWNSLFPARRFEMEQTRAEPRATVKADPGAGGRAFVMLTATNASLSTPPIRVATVPALRWLVRARGNGVLAASTTAGPKTAVMALHVQSQDWTWLEIPVQPFEEFEALNLTLTLQSGALDLDLGLLSAGPWRQIGPGESVTLPAALFFHAGYSDPASGGVVLRRNYDSRGAVLYGPKLPLPRGMYEVRIDFASQALSGAVLGAVNIEQPDAAGEDKTRTVLALCAGQPAIGRWRQQDNLPFNLVVDYNGSADLEIRDITFTRLK